jgi:hypothetical protein
VADLLLGYNDNNWETSFIGINTPNYIKYVALNLGLGGLFTYRSPRTFIEGYTDPVLMNLASDPVIWGGDATVNTWIQIDPPTTTSPSLNNITFFTGDGNPGLTRTYQSWLGNQTIKVSSLRYNNTITVEPYLANPWQFEVAINGTDGKQFGGNQATSNQPSVFYNSLSRNVGFVSDGQTTSTASNRLSLMSFVMD